MVKILTKRKEKWVNNFRPDLVRGLALTPNAAVEVRYYTQLASEIDRMSAYVEKRLRRLFNSEPADEYFAMDASISSQSRILTNALMKKFDAIFADIAKPAATTMTNGANAASSTAVHASLKQLSGGMSLPTSAITPDMKEILNATIAENVSLIKSISEQYLDGVQGAVMRSITTGNGMQDLVPFLEKHRGITLRRARMIARDQSKKAFSNFSKARMENLGVTSFEWLHSGGGKKPRKLHQSYDGKVFSFDDLPIIEEGTTQRGIPGQAINCGCKMVPVLQFNGE